MSKKRSSLNPWVLIIVGAAVGIASYLMNTRELVGPFTLFGGIGALLFAYGLLKRLFTRKPKKSKPDTYHTAHESQSHQKHPDRTYQDTHGKPAPPQTGASYCPNCGSRVHPASNFCHSCGSKLR